MSESIQILKKVQKTIEKYRMLDRGDSVLVAVSGGPDSTALLNVLVSLRDKYDLSLAVAHLNHMLRGKDAERDMEFVRELSKNLGLQFFFAKKNVRSFIKKTHLSPEEAARKVRYKFLQDVSKREGMNKVALGQNADDQAETVLLAFLRGSGLAGLSGIPPVRLLDSSMNSFLQSKLCSYYGTAAALQTQAASLCSRTDCKGEAFRLREKRDFNIKVIRPLIEIFRIEIEKYLEEKGIASRLDASNLEPVYLRNRIRLGLLPLIAHEYNPNIKLALVKLAGILREDNCYLVEETGKIAEQMLNFGWDMDVERRSAGRNKCKSTKVKLSTHTYPLPQGEKVQKGNSYIIKINLLKFKSVPAALQQRLVRKAVNEVCGNMRPLSLVHWEEIQKLIEKGKTGSRIVLGDEVAARKEYGDLVISREKSKRCRSNLDYKLKVQGKNYMPEIGIVISANLLRREDVHRLGMGTDTACFDYDSIKTPIHIRFRKNGDRFRALGMRGSKKLKDFFIDEKVPSNERDSIPLLVDNGEIIWVMDVNGNGWGRIGEKVKVTEKTTRVLQFNVVITP